MEQLPRSYTEAKVAGARFYFTGRPCRYGHVAARNAGGTCVVCAAEYKARPDVKRRNSESAKRFDRANPERAKQRIVDWINANRDRLNERERNRRKKHIDHVRAQARRYKKLRPPPSHVSCAYVALRRARKVQATPAWADRAALRQFYKNRPDGYHVDHVIPLRHGLVCGLHVVENLQYLTASENSIKRNNFQP